MRALLTALADMSLSGGAAACAALLLRPLLGRVSRRFSYLLWAVVFWRFSCPLPLESHFSLLPRRAAQALAEEAARPGGVFLAPAPASPAAAVPALGGGPSPAAVLLCLWLLGVLVLTAYAVHSYCSVRRRVCDATRIRDNLYESDRIPTAFVLGLLRPRIYVPTALRDAELILRHEAVHIRRRDYLIKPAAFFILALHWFNPLAWVSYRLMVRDMELSCDEAVLRGAAQDVRRAYSLLLVRLYAGDASACAPLAFGLGSMKAMKGRIDHVLHFQTPRPWAAVLCSLLLVLFTAGFAADPAAPAGLAPAAGPVGEAGEKGGGYVGRRESLIQSFAPLSDFGVTYDPDQDAAFYQGGRVKLMVIFQPQTPEDQVGYAFRLCYRDHEAGGALYLEGVTDESGRLTGVRPLDPALAAELLGVETGGGPGGPPKDLPSSEEFPFPEEGDLPAGPEDYVYVVMDGTQIMESRGITARDLPREEAGEAVRAWMERCGGSEGAYVLQTRREDVHVTYLYYNGGGRYPWRLTAEGDRLEIELVEDSPLATGEGYHLMYLESPEACTDLHLFLGGRELPLL